MKQKKSAIYTIRQAGVVLATLACVVPELTLGQNITDNNGVILAKVSGGSCTQEGGVYYPPNYSCPATSTVTSIGSCQNCVNNSVTYLNSISYPDVDLALSIILTCADQDRMWNYIGKTTAGHWQYQCRIYDSGSAKRNT